MAKNDFDAAYEKYERELAEREASKAFDAAMEKYEREQKVADAPAVFIEPKALIEPSWLPVPGTPGFQEDVERVATERAQKLAVKRGATQSEEQALIDLEKQEEEARRLRTVSAGGGVEGGAAPPGSGLPIAPILRTSRLVPTEYETLYRDPETGDLRKPTTGELFTESFARQPVMTEEEALTFRAQRESEDFDKAALKNILTSRKEGEGVVETAAGALLRSAPLYMENALAEAYFGGLGYEEGDPQDDLGRKIATYRKKLGIPDAVSLDQNSLLGRP
jgi:hypothetical protein